jgi:hypothetical protein
VLLSNLCDFIVRGIAEAGSICTQRHPFLPCYTVPAGAKKRMRTARMDPSLAKS